MRRRDLRVPSIYDTTHASPFTRILIVAITTVMILSATGLPARAISNTTPFELDRNALKQTNDDWDNVLGWNAATHTQVAPTGTDIGHTFVNDYPTDTTYFTGGGSKDGNPISSWAYNSGGAQDKDQITNAYAAAYLVNNSIQLYFGDDRYANAGNSTMGFWFLQNQIGTSGGKFTGAHKVGDILIVSDLPSTASNIRVFEWNGSGITDVTPTGGADCTTAPASAPICFTTNTAPTTAPWPYTPKMGTSGTFPAGSFLEGGVNLASLFPGTQAPCFASFLAESRSSNSPPATLSDFALGGINTCGEVNGQKFNDLNANGAKNPGEPGLQGWTITAKDKATNGSTFTTTATTDANGNYSLQSIPPGEYIICETQQSGWTQSFPAAGVSCSPGNGYDITLTLGQIVNGKDFGNFQNRAALSVTKVADSDTVNSGDQIGYTITISNAGPGIAQGVKLSDVLPTNAGLSWSIDTTVHPPSAGWGGTCAISATNPKTLTCGGASGVSLASGSSLSVHIVSPTTTATCGGTVSNHATASLTNGSTATVDSSVSTITVLCPDLTVTKTPDAATVNAGQQIGYTITVSNNGAGTAAGVKLSDVLPTNAGLNWSIDTVTNPPSAGWGGTCAISATAPKTLTCGGTNGVSLASGASLSVHIISPTTAATCGGTVSNTASVTSTNDGNPTSQASVITVQCPNLSVTKTPDNATVNAGDPIGYTITVSNAGPGTASGVKLSDVLPTNAGLSWSIDTTTNPPSAGWGGTCAISATSPKTLTCSGAAGVSLASGASLSVHIVSPTTSATCGGTVSNQATVSLTNGSTATVSSNVSTITVNCPSLAVTKIADHTPVNAGDQIGYTITISNTGSGTATGVKLSDVLPTNAGLSWSIDTTTNPPSAGWGGTCAISATNPKTLTCGGANGVSLAGGASLSVHIVSPTTAATCGGTVSNQATVSLTNGSTATVSSNISQISVQCPSLTVTKTPDNATVNAGDQVGYTITVSNAGPGTASGVKLSDVLPTNAGLSWSIDTTTNPPSAGWGGTCAISATNPKTLTCGGANGVSLASGASLSVHIVSPTTAATCGSTIQNQATVSLTNGSTATVSSNLSQITVNCPSLDITKTPDNATVNAGDQIGYTITISNTGLGTASGVKLSDVLPTNAGLSWSIDTTTNPPSAGWGGTCAISATAPITLTCGGATGVTLLSGASLSVHIVSPTSPATCGGTISNIASATSGNDGSPSTLPSTITVNCPNLSVTKTPDNATVNAGDQIGYTIVVSNAGPGTASGVKLSDVLPANSGLSWSIDTTTNPPSAGWGGTCAISATNPKTLTCGGANGVSLASGASLSVHIVSPTTAASCGGTVSNQATVSLTNGSTATVSSSVSTITVQCPNLSITKTPDNNPVNAGDQIGYTITISNAGPGAASGVKLSDVLPSNAGLNWSIDTTTNPPSAGWGGTCAISTTDPKTLTCGGANGVSLASGASLSVHIVSPTTAATCAGTVSNQATVSLTNGSTGTVTSSVSTITVQCPSLTVSKIADHATVNSGDQIGYTITILNTGTGTASGVKLSDVLPSNGGLSWSIDTTTNPPSAGWGGTCAISATAPITLTCGGANGVSLAGGASLSVHIVSPTTAATCGGTVSNQATVSLTNGTTATVSSNVSIITVQCPNVTITKTADNDTVNAGSQIGYVIRVSNAGPGTATNVVVTDALPGGQGLNWSLSPANTPAGCSISGAVGSQTLVCNFATLAPGAHIDIHVVSPTTAGVTCGPIVNVASVAVGNGTGSSTAPITIIVSNGQAITHGGAYGVDVNALGLHLIDKFGLIATVAPGSPQVAESQLAVIPIPGIVTITLVRQTSDSAVTDEAVSTATSTVAGVNLLSGAITADVVKGVSQSVATSTSASSNSAGSTFTNLKINGKSVVNVVPNLTVDVKNPLPGGGTIARAVLYEETKSSSLTAGKFVATHSVNMIHVTLLKPFLTLPVGAEIIVAHANSDATYPAGCGVVAGTVSGEAFTAFAQGSLNGVPIATVKEGDAVISPLGGSDSDVAANVNVPGIVFATAANNSASGSVLTNPNSNARSVVTGVNLLNGVVTADVLDVASTSTTTATTASTAFNTTFLNLVIGGTPIGGNPAPNTTFAIPQPDGSLILLILNEQTIGGNGTKDTEGTVNAIHLWVLKGAAIQLEVIVASAHSDAHHL